MSKNRPEIEYKSLIADYTPKPKPVTLAQVIGPSGNRIASRSFEGQLIAHRDGFYRPAGHTEELVMDINTFLKKYSPTKKRR